MPGHSQDTGIIRIVDENLRQGFAQVPRPVLRAKGLSIKAKTVYVLLLDYAWQQGCCFPGHDRLADDLDVSVDTVQRALAELKRFGLVDWKRQGLNRPNIYYLLPLAENPRLALADPGNRKLRFPETAGLRHQETATSGTKNTQRTIPSKTLRKAHARKSDGETETTVTPANSPVPGRTVSHPSQSMGPEASGEGEPSIIPTRASVEPDNASDPSNPGSISSAGRTAILPDPVAKSDPSETPAKQDDGEGFRRLRDQAMKIREEMRRQRERDAAEVDENGTRPYVSARTKGRPAGSREDRDRVAAYLRDFQPELGDEAPLASSVTRALNIFRTAQIPPDRWADCLYQARSITKERSAQITRKPGGRSSGFAAKNRAPYFFAILEDLVGLRGQADPAVPSTP